MVLNRGCANSVVGLELTGPFRSDCSQKRPDVHKIVLSLKSRPPPPEKVSISRILYLGGHFGPEKKIFSPPTPPRTPSDRLCAPPRLPSSQTLPPLYFQIKSKAPFSPRTSPPFPSPRTEKKIKNIRNVRQDTDLYRFSLIWGPFRGWGGLNQILRTRILWTPRLSESDLCADATRYSHPWTSSKASV